VPVLALLAYFWSALHVGYHVGMASAHASIWNLHVGQNRTEELCLPLTNPAGPEVGGALATQFKPVPRDYASKMTPDFRHLMEVDKPVADNLDLMRQRYAQIGGAPDHTRYGWVSRG